MKRTILVAMTVVGLAAASSAPGAAAGPNGDPAVTPPLKVKISTKDGTSKINVAKKVQVLTSCSVSCKMTAKVAIVSKGDSLKHTFKTGLKPNVLFRPGFLMSAAGLAFLKDNYKVSRFSITVLAVDVATGKTVKKSRSYGFKR